VHGRKSFSESYLSPPFVLASLISMKDYEDELFAMESGK